MDELPLEGAVVVALGVVAGVLVDAALASAAPPPAMTPATASAANIDFMRRILFTSFSDG